jgi:hypothetical protein
LLTAVPTVPDWLPGLVTDTVLPLLGGVLVLPWDTVTVELL